MKYSIKTKALIVALVMGSAMVIGMNACKVPDSITAKSGAQLWGENCNRCHNAPDPHTFSDDQWDAASEHMRQKALLTDMEITKIRVFLKTANK